MRLIFYKTVESDDGNPTSELVMIVEALASGVGLVTENLPVPRGRLANWREFADFFEIV
jgi:hypothetical protein